MNKELAVLAAMEAEMSSIPGHVGFYDKNLVTVFAKESRHLLCRT